MHTGARRSADVVLGNRGQEVNAEAEHAAEMQRLIHVALTRARDQLFLVTLRWNYKNNTLETLLRLKCEWRENSLVNWSKVNYWLQEPAPFLRPLVALGLPYVKAGHP